MKGCAASRTHSGAALPGEVHVQLYVTPAGTYSYSWHYDLEDVFVAQMLGIKDYHLRDNTVARHTRLGESLDFSCIRDETSHMMAARLIVGDWLYIPRRCGHAARRDVQCPAAVRDTR